MVHFGLVSIGSLSALSLSHFGSIGGILATFPFSMASSDVPPNASDFVGCFGRLLMRLGCRVASIFGTDNFESIASLPIEYVGIHSGSRLVLLERPQSGHLDMWNPTWHAEAGIDRRHHPGIIP